MPNFNARSFVLIIKMTCIKHTFTLQITEDRSKLPIASFKDTITSTIESNQV